jgi:hypothetical protein
MPGAKEPTPEEVVEVDVPGGGKLSIPAALAGQADAIVAALDAARPQEIPAAGPEATIYDRLARILDELPAIGKDQTNTQQGFKYRGHDDVMAALNPLLAKHGVFLVPKTLRREPSVRTTNRGTALYEISLLVRFEFFGTQGDSVAAEVWGEGTDSGDKATSKALTMAFKSALAVVLAISTHELSDADATSAEETVAGGGGAAPAAGGRESRPKRGRKLDPGNELLEGAISGEGFVQKIAVALNAIGPNVDWRATIAPYLPLRFHVETREEIPEDRLPEYWRRLSNFVARLSGTTDVSSFPPVTDREPEVVLSALSWAFASVPEKSEIVFREAEPQNDETQAAEGEIPWTDDVKKALAKEDAAVEDADAAADDVAAVEETT